MVRGVTSGNARDVSPTMSLLSWSSGLPVNFYNEGWMTEEIDDGPTGFLEYQTGLLSRMGEKVGGSNGMKGVVLLVCGSSWSLHLIHAFACILEQDHSGRC